MTRISTWKNDWFLIVTCLQRKLLSKQTGLRDDDDQQWLLGFQEDVQKDLGNQALSVTCFQRPLETPMLIFSKCDCPSCSNDYDSNQCFLSEVLRLTLEAWLACSCSHQEQSGSSYFQCPMEDDKESFCSDISLIMKEDICEGCQEVPEKIILPLKNMWMLIWPQQSFLSNTILQYELHYLVTNFNREWEKKSWKYLKVLLVKNSVFCSSNEELF